ncbi:MAG: Trm112 family protein [Planctomycetota bacterium]
MIDEALLQVMRCPADLGELEDKDEVLRCKSCGRRYPVRDGIPIMIVDEADGVTSSQDASPKESAQS